MMGQWLSERLGQQFIIENRPGGGTNLATEAVVRAQPDGYTLLNLTTTNAINATNIAPVASMVHVPVEHGVWKSQRHGSPAPTR